jgi:hypothetical protein
MSPETDEVFRDAIMEPRDGFNVEYVPARTGGAFATAGLTFTSEIVDAEKIKRSMDEELAFWLKLYRVPLFVSSFDAKGDLITIEPYSHLMGFLDADNHLIKRWGEFTNEELPADQVTQGYLANVYRNVPFRFAEDVRWKVRREARIMKVTGLSIVLFTVIIPVLIEMVSWGVEWLGHLLEAGSFFKGLHEIGKALGWIKPSQKETDKALRKQKMEHYFYHCEKNPAAFQRLKFENFENEEKKSILSEDAALRGPNSQ